MAVGKYSDLDSPETYVLSGAVVSGPDKRDHYYDIRDDWPQTQVVPFGVVCCPRLIYSTP